jgi:hypothetical protein
MPDYKPNQFVRAFAVLALVAAVILVAVVVVTSHGGGDDNGGKGEGHKNHVSKAGRQAIRKGVWIVETTLQALNPDLDPQTLLEGQRIALR